MTLKDNPSRRKRDLNRWQLIRDIISLQIKLVIDGFRDFLLVPVSVITGIISLVRPGEYPGTEFYSLLKLGRKTDHWINLFSAADRPQGHDHWEADSGNGDVDDMINRLEHFVVKEYQEGTVTRQAREHFEQILKTVGNRNKPGGKDDSPDK